MLIDPGHVLDISGKSLLLLCSCFIVIKLELIHIQQLGPCTCPQELNWIKVS